MLKGCLDDVFIHMMPCGGQETLTSPQGPRQ